MFGVQRVALPLKDLPKRRVLYAPNFVDQVGLHGAFEPALDLLVLRGGAGQCDDLVDTW